MSSSPPAVVKTSTRIVRRVQRVPAQAKLGGKAAVAVAASKPSASAQAISGTSNVAVTTAVAVTSALKAVDGIKRVPSTGILSKNKLRWRRQDSPVIADVGANKTSSEQADARRTGPPAVQRRAPVSSTADSFPAVTSETLKFATKFSTANSSIQSRNSMSRINRRLRRINDKIYTGASKECFDFAQRGTCVAGVFCSFDHNGDSSHRTEAICERLMMGLCRRVNCRKSHKLTKYQMPVCDYFLRCMCSNEECRYLHVKHTDGAKKCDRFNLGTCVQGVNCSMPHRYYFSVIRKKSKEVMLDDMELMRKSADNDGNGRVTPDDEHAVLDWIM